MEPDMSKLQEKVQQYQQVLTNTRQYRKQWKKELRKTIVSTLENVIKATGLKAHIVVQDSVENLESVILDLGKTSSGIVHNVEDTDVSRTMIKANGGLVYQQLFNGKIMVMIDSPHIEGHGQPKPAKPLEILRPDELNTSFIYRHIEALLKDITDWEDFDDNDPVKTPIGFHPQGTSGA